MSASPRQRRWLTEEMLEAAQAASRHDDLRNSGERCLHIVGWLQAHMAEADRTKFDALVFGPDRALLRAQPITSVDDERVKP